MDNTMSEYELREMELFIRKARLELAMGQAIAREDFLAWAKTCATWVLDRLEAAWNWVRHALGLL